MASPSFGIDLGMTFSAIGLMVGKSWIFLEDISDDASIPTFV
jgi:molecular chaperone DnaK (HSP70)